ncbi:MAG: RNA polymerase factor sigma-54 [Bacteriovoracaceae bacterium]|nr:RNA polymerase factor sigma-54 [Bacteriovoracaceae bacterium]
MKMSQSLKQTQSLMMTPQLQQAIKLLTLTHLEMTNVIAEEMVENPMLEESDITVVEQKDKREDDYKIDKLEMQNSEASLDNFCEKPLMTRDDFDWNSYIESCNDTSYNPPNLAQMDFDELPNYENIVSSTNSLADHLQWQLRMNDLQKDQWPLAERIINNINDDGYLEIPFDEIIAEVGCEREFANEVLFQVQKLDPVGCGSQNLTDCLLAQAKILEERSPLLELLIKNHLVDLQRRDYKKITKETGASEDLIKEISQLLKNFHPRPGRLVVTEEIHYVVPDIYVYEVGGEFVIKLNDEGVPNLRISPYYKSALKKMGDANKEEKEYVTERLKSAAWLIKSIHNRKKTIYKVASEIVRMQQEFFKSGPKHLKPMVLKDVAQVIGMHESTVSRVTTNKYMHTPIGLFELKYFFNTGVGGKSGGVDVASEVLKIKIKALLDNENPKRPLSDQKISELLGREGIKIARRTVAKYREMMDYLPSSKRKRKD